MDHDKYVFLDKSGDLGSAPGSSNHFVITLLVTSDRKTIENKLRKYKRNLTRKKKYKRLNELKAHNSDDEIRFEVLDIIIKSDAEIYAIILNKTKSLDGPGYEKSKVYNYLTSFLIAECGLSHKKVHFIIDKSTKKKIVREDFNDHVIRSHPKVRFAISHLDSFNSNGLQLADFASWSIFRRYENTDERFWNRVSGKIRFKKELTKNKLK